MGEQLQEYVYAYYNAVINGDYDKEQKLLEQLRDLVITYFTLFGGRYLSEIVNIVDVLPSEVSYVPTEGEIISATSNFEQVLLGLSERINQELDDYAHKNSNKTLDEIKEDVGNEQMYQAVRIIVSQLHIFEEKSKLDVVTSIFSSGGYILTKTWICRLLPTSCPYCVAMHNTTIPINENFVYNGNEITLDSHYSDMANAHPHCGCKIRINVEKI